MTRQKVLIVFLAVALGLVPAACSGDKNKQSELDRQMDMAMAGDSAAAQLSDTAQTAAAPVEQPAPKPVQQPAPKTPVKTTPQPTPQPAPTPAPQPAPKPSYEMVTVPAGTNMVVSLNQELGTKTNQVGDTWTATLKQPITSGSRVVVPAGAKVIGKVTAVQQSKGSGQPAVLKLSVEKLSFAGNTYPLQASVVQANAETKGRQSTGEKAAKIGGGAALGGIIGRVVGGNATGTIIGAAVGAAAGTAITLGTQDVDAVLPAGSEMVLSTDQSTDVRWEQ